MRDHMNLQSKSALASAQGELMLSDLVNATSTYSTSDPGPDPTFDEDPIPEVSGAR